MKNISTLLLAFSLMILVGCSSLNKQFASQNTGPRIISAMIADYEIGEKVNGSSSIGFLFSIIPIGGDDEFADGVRFISYATEAEAQAAQFKGLFGGQSLQQTKKAAAYKALQNSGHEYIVNPRYTIKVSNYLIWKEMSCTVEGWGANLKGFRKVDDKYFYKD